MCDRLDSEYLMWIIILKIIGCMHNCGMPSRKGTYFIIVTTWMSFKFVLNL